LTSAGHGPEREEDGEQLRPGDDKEDEWWESHILSKATRARIEALLPQLEVGGGRLLCLWPGSEFYGVQARVGSDVLMRSWDTLTEEEKVYVKVPTASLYGSRPAGWSSQGQCSG
jgi:hypothetical protein